MKKRVLPAILLMIFVLCGSGAAQNMPEPYQEKLLNGLKVLVWNEPGTDKVTLKLRIHSGAQFDPKDKMGVMALLSDIIFPDPQTFSYFEEELDGKLQVAVNYDYIQITATGKADEFVNMLDTVRAGIVNTAINQENFVKVRDARLERAKEEAAKMKNIADRAAAKRLLGDFPYGRPEGGTPESLARIDRFDLVTAREKFLDADNATLAIVGKIDPKFAIKAVKQLIGSWGKSEGLVPATFAQPGEPETKIQLIDQPGAAATEVRFAVRGLASNDKDRAALNFWTLSFRDKLIAALPAECNGSVRVISQPHLLPGILLISGTFPADSTARCFNIAKSLVAKADSEKWEIKTEDFTKFKNDAIGLVRAGYGDLNYISDLWLNADTFKWGKASDEFTQVSQWAPDSFDKAATRIFWKSPVVSVIVGDAAKIKPQFDPSGQFSLTPEQEEQIKKEVVEFINSWKASSEKRDVDENLKHYAPKLEIYYRETGKDQKDIRAERAKAFDRYDSIRLDLFKIAVKPESETAATAIFDKKWQYRGRDTISTGAALQLIKLVKTNGQWQIVEEKDLQIYSADTKQIPPPQSPPAKPQ